MGTTKQSENVKVTYSGYELTPDLDPPQVPSSHSLNPGSKQDILPRNKWDHIEWAWRGRKWVAVNVNTKGTMSGIQISDVG